MKIKLPFVWLLGLGVCGLLSFAQSDTNTPPAETAAAATNSAPEAVGSALTNAAPDAVGATVTNAAPDSLSLDGTNAAPQTASATVTGETNSVPASTNLVDQPGPDFAQGGLKDPASPAAVVAENRGPLTLEQELPAAIAFLARMANLNVQFDPSLTFTNSLPGPDGKLAGAPIVSLKWENVTAEDALQEVLDNYGLMLVMNPRTSIGRITRKPNVAPMITGVVQLRYASPSNVLEVIKSTFADPLHSKVTADYRTSQLVIVTTEREMYAVTNLINQLDTPTKQVLIEARLLETAKNPTTMKGIDWSGTLQNQNFSFGNGLTRFQSTTVKPGTPTSTTLPSGRNVTGQPGSSTSATADTLGGGREGGLTGPLISGLTANTARGFNPSTAFLNADGVQAVLFFLNTENDTEVVATPRAVTLDNQTATLSVTRAYPIFETTPGSANVASAAQTKYTNLGTILKVTPRITANETIALKVVPEVSNIDSKDRQIINGSVNEANVYAIRRMEADVVIPSGNTLVMGGLISDSTSKSFTKVPILGDLPGIGLAFRRDIKSRNKVNLIIFVTPTIIRDDDFQPTPTVFLRTPIPERPDVDESAWDSGKPYQWGKNSKK